MFKEFSTILFLVSTDYSGITVASAVLSFFLFYGSNTDIFIDKTWQKSNIDIIASEMLARLLCSVL